MSKSPSQYAPNDAALEHSKSKALEQSISRLQADHAERSAERRARYAEDARIQDRVRDLMFGHLRSKEVELKQLAEDRRRLIEGRPPNSSDASLWKDWLRACGVPLRYGAEDVRQSSPHTTSPGPREAVKVAKAPLLMGNIELNAQAFGEKSVGGGIGFWFPAAAGGARRFSTTCRFSFEWSESASFMLRTITAAYGSRCGVCPRTVGSVRAAISFRPGWTTSGGMNCIRIAVVAKRLRSCFSTPSPMVCTRAGSMLRSVAMRITVSRVFRFNDPYARCIGGGIRRIS